MKEYQTFLSEQLELLTEKGSKASSSLSGQSPMKGLGHAGDAVSMQRMRASSETSPIFKNTFHNKSWLNFHHLLTSLPRLWQNFITPAEAKNLGSVWENMPPSPRKDEIADAMQDVALLPSGNERTIAFKGVINKFKQQVYDTSVQGTEYKSWGPYTDTYDSTKRTTRF